VLTPVHLDLAGRPVLVVGGGPVGVRRARALVASGARVRLVSPELAEPVEGADHVARAFRADDVDGCWLVVAATGVVDAEVGAACEERRVWCVRSDDAAASAAWLPAVGRVDDVVVSVTAGRDPRRATAVRDAVLRHAGELPLRRQRPGPGHVAVVGGGPGDPGLLTVRARELLAQADVVVRDRLAPVVELADDVEVVEVGKSPRGPSWRQQDIDRLLVEHGTAGRRVVRLKGGDVHVFARGIEEVTACLDAGLAVEVVPGVSSALAAPTLAGVPLTAKGVTQSVTVVSAHLAPGDPGSTVDWPALARLGGTLVLLMAVERLAACCAALVAGGRDASTPVAVVERASLPDQRVSTATLADAGSLAVAAPAVVVVGEVVALARPATG
jgi:uroporphyrin-III C-methyltransferase / precorrin-2 dehydrogenase / sirohydrochlorin ferrochelatase